MTNRWIFYCLLLLFIGTNTACNPYKGFSGVNSKGMKVNKAPSQKLDEDYKKQEKKMKRRYERETKKRERQRGKR